MYPRLNESLLLDTNLDKVSPKVRFKDRLKRRAKSFDSISLDSLRQDFLHLIKKISEAHIKLPFKRMDGWAMTKHFRCDTYKDHIEIQDNTGKFNGKPIKDDRGRPISKTYIVVEIRGMDDADITGANIAEKIRRKCEENCTYSCTSECNVECKINDNRDRHCEFHCK